MINFELSPTYDHRTLKTRLPVRSALFKQRTGGLVVRWVTTSESPLLYVFAFFFLASLPLCEISASGQTLSPCLSGLINLSLTNTTHE
jgi:hypothetical protein